MELKRDDASGSWSGSGNWKNRYYQFEVTNWQRTVVVTDPYSVALSVNSTHSQFADLRDAKSMPAGWSSDVARGMGGAITELHVRDFSINDESVPAADRGTYKAFTHRDSVGMKHLRTLWLRRAWTPCICCRRSTSRRSRRSARSRPRPRVISRLVARGL